MHLKIFLRARTCLRVNKTPSLRLITPSGEIDITSYLQFISKSMICQIVFDFPWDCTHLEQAD